VVRYTPKTYFLNPAHEEIAKSRYYLKNNRGLAKEKNIFAAFKRVNGYIFRKDTAENKELAQRLCEEKKIMYAGRPLAQAGTGIKNMFNCFVLGIGDSRAVLSWVLETVEKRYQNANEFIFIFKPTGVGQVSIFQSFARAVLGAKDLMPAPVVLRVLLLLWVTSLLISLREEIVVVLTWGFSKTGTPDC
jgi:hypothetical protein